MDGWTDGWIDGQMDKGQEIAGRLAGVDGEIDGQMDRTIFLPDTEHKIQGPVCAALTGHHQLITKSWIR